MNLNGVLLESRPEPLGAVERAMFYADGLFETIRVFKGQIPFLDLHWERLSRGLHTLGMRPLASWSAGYFREEIKKMASFHARVRLTVWRAPGGFYAPSEHHPHFMITETPVKEDVFIWNKTGLRVRQCERVRIPVDALSGLKTLGATRYVVAAMEAREKEVDDVIVLNTRNRVCEASSSNVFWIKNGVVFAPLPTDGQVTGVCQEILCRVLSAEGIKVQKKAAGFASLLEADEVFLTNAVQGIRWVQFLEGKELSCERSVYFNKLMVNYLHEKTAPGSP